MAFAIVDTAGTVKGTASTLERRADGPGNDLRVVEARYGERTSRACDFARLSCSLIATSFDWEMVEGMGRECEASKTEY